MIPLLRRWLAFAAAVAVAVRRTDRARATVDRNRRRRRHRDSDRDRPVRRRRRRIRSASRHRRRRPRAFGTVPPRRSERVSCRVRCARRTCSSAYGARAARTPSSSGSMLPLPDGRADVRFALVDVVKQAPLVSDGVSRSSPQQFRVTAHKIADVIYEKLTGDRGVFSTRIAYVTKQGPRFQLLVADADGSGRSRSSRRTSRCCRLAGRPTARASPMSRSKTESRSSTCSRSTPASGSAVANFRGSNSSPAWSPDGAQARRDALQGRRLADVPDEPRRQRHGACSRRRRSTPRHVRAQRPVEVFASDRGGSPQIYRAEASLRSRGETADVQQQLQRVAEPLSATARFSSSSAQRQRFAWPR